MFRFFLFAFATFFLVAAAYEPNFEINGIAPGTISFIGDAGSPNEFVVEKWQFTKIESPDNPASIHLVAELDMRTIKTDWKELERSLKKKKDYFFVKKFPRATVTIQGATAQEDGSWRTDAILTLKGITKTVPLTFTLSEEAPYTVTAEGVINRRMFKFTGGGPKDEVPVRIEARLE